MQHIIFFSLPFLLSPTHCLSLVKLSFKTHRQDEREFNHNTGNIKAVSTLLLHYLFLFMLCLLNCVSLLLQATKVSKSLSKQQRYRKDSFNTCISCSSSSPFSRASLSLSRLQILKSRKSGFNNTSREKQDRPQHRLFFYFFFLLCSHLSPQSRVVLELLKTQNKSDFQNNRGRTKTASTPPSRAHAAKSVPPSPRCLQDGRQRARVAV